MGVPLKSRKHLLVGMLMAGAILLGGGITAKLHFNRLHRESDRQQTALFQAHVEESIRTFYFVYGEMPGSIDEMRTAGAFEHTPDEFSWMVEHGHVDSSDFPTASFEDQIFAEACKKSIDSLAQWDRQRAEAQRRLKELDGQLDKQLQLFTDPDFDGTLAVSFLRHLETEVGIPKELLLEFQEAHGNMRIANALANKRKMFPKEFRSFWREREADYRKRVAALVQAILAARNGGETSPVGSKY